MVDIKYYADLDVSEGKVSTKVGYTSGTIFDVDKIPDPSQEDISGLTFVYAGPTNKRFGITFYNNKRYTGAEVGGVLKWVDTSSVPDGLTPERVVTSVEGGLTTSPVTSDELQALVGIGTESIATQLSGKVDKTTTVNGHPLSENVEVTREDLNLQFVDNTSDTDKPISTLQQEEFNKKVDKTTTVNGHPLSGNVDVTKEDLYLQFVDNTSDTDKPISTLQQEALDKKADKTALKSVDSKVDLHIANVANPHGVTKDQVGLGLADNTPDTEKPVSNPQQKALDEKANITDVNKTFESYIPRNISEKIATDVVLTPGADKLDLTTNQFLTADGTTTSNVQSFPIVSSSQAGLMLPAEYNEIKKNTQDIATLSGRSIRYVVELSTETPDRDTLNAAYIAASGLELPPKDGTTLIDTTFNKEYTWFTSKAAWVDRGSATVSKATNTTLGIVKGTENVDGKIFVETDGSLSLIGYNDIVNDISNQNETINLHINNKDNPHSVTKAQVGLGSVDDTSDKDKPVSTATQKALDLKEDKTVVEGINSKVDLHIANTKNPHSVTKDQVGLGLADNTSDADKPISTATRAALDEKADSTTVSAIDSKVIAHIANENNPHKVTKLQVGLGSVDDTADMDKPISTATQNALDGKLKSDWSEAADGTFLKVNDTGGIVASNLPDVLWGELKGTLSNQSDLQVALDSKLAAVGGITVYASDAYSNQVRNLTYSSRLPSDIDDGKDGDVWLTPGEEEKGTAVKEIPKGMFQLQHDTIYRGEVITELNFTLPLAGLLDLFDSELDISVGSTPLQVIAPEGIDWMGDDISKGAWVPQLNKRYVLFVYWDGVRFRAISQAQKVVL